MKFLLVLAFVAVAAAFPQREGAAFSNEAIKQAQSTLLIPKDAEIQKVKQSSIIRSQIWPSTAKFHRESCFEIQHQEHRSPVVF